MSVNNGDAVSAEITNAAFMSRTENTDTVGSVGLLKPTGSGALILDAQKTINNVIAATGMADQDATTLEFTGTTHIVDGTIKDALEDLDAAIVADEGDLAAHMLDNSTHGVGEIVGTTESQVLTNKDIDGGTASNTSRITLPKAAKATLDGLARKEATLVYASDEDKVYYDDGSTLKAVGTGSGSGGVNFITNSDGEAGTTGWTTYNGVLTASAFASSDTANCGTAHNIPSGVYDIKVKILSVSTPCNLTAGAEYYAVYSSSTFVLFTTTIAGTPVDITADATITFSEIRPRVAFGTANVTWTTTSTNPLSGVSSFLLTKDAANRQYQGVMSDFSIDLARKSKMLKVSFDYIVNSGTFVAGSSTTDSDVIVYLYDVTNSTLIEPSSFKFLSNSTTISDKFSATFQTSATGTQYRLIFHVASTSTAAYALKLDNVSVSPSQYVYGTPITDWQSYTPTWTATVTNPVIGNGTITGKYRRVGDSAEITIKIDSGSTTTYGSGGYSFGLPPGLSIDISKDSDDFGTMNVYNNASPLNAYIGKVLRNTLTTVRVVGTGVSVWTNTTPTTLTAIAGNSITGNMTVPILGWSSSVQVSDGYEGRDVSFFADNKDTAQTGINPNGSSVILNFANSRIDKVSGWNGTNTYTVKSSATYKVSGIANISGGNVLATRYFTAVYRNGVEVARGTQVWATAGQFFGLPFEALVDAKADDTISVYLYGAGNNSVNTLTSDFGSISIVKNPGSPTISATETVSALYTGAPPTGTLNSSLNLATFGTKVDDTHGAYTSGEYTIQESGKYDIMAQIGVASTFSAGNASTVAIFIDGVSKYEGVFRVVAAITTSVFPKVEVKGVPLVAGQKISIRALAEGTSPSYVASAAHNFFSISKRK